MVNGGVIGGHFLGVPWIMVRLNWTVISSLCLSMIFSENRSPLFRIMLWHDRGRSGSEAGALRMALLHAPVQCRDAAVAGRLVEHRIALGRERKGFRVAGLFHFKGVKAGAQHEQELVTQYLT